MCAQYVEAYGQKLDQVQPVGRIKVGEQRQKIQIRYIISPDGVLQRSEAAVISEKLDPWMQEIC